MPASWARRERTCCYSWRTRRSSWWSRRARPCCTPNPSSAFVFGASGGTVEGGSWAWDPRVGAHPAVRVGALLPNSILCLSCAAGPRERYLCLIYLDRSSSHTWTRCLRAPKFSYSAPPLPARCAPPFSPTSACLPVYPEPEGSTPRTPSRGQKP